MDARQRWTLILTLVGPSLIWWDSTFFFVFLTVVENHRR